MSNALVREVDDATFAEVVDGSAQPVVVEFFATWCGNCHRLETTLARVTADSAAHARFVKVNVDENPDLVSAYGVASTPTLVLVTRHGAVAAPLVGAQPEESVRDWLMSALHQSGTGGREDAHRGWVAADACTLPTADQPLRVAEFDKLFNESLHAVRRDSGTRLRLSLDATAEAAARDLAVRETDCCEFFTFTVKSVGDRLIDMDIAVPAGREDVLDGLAAHAAAARAA